MSTTSFGQVRSAGDERATSTPGFLLRGAIHRKSELIPWPSVGSIPLMRGGGVTAVVLAAAFGAYVLVADQAPKRSADATRQDHSAPSVPHEPDSAAPTSVSSDTAQSQTETANQEHVTTSRRQQNLDAPRVVRTERFDGDPSVWANVRKFVPLPPDQVPVLDIEPAAEPPAAAPAALDSSKDTGVPHAKAARAQRHRHGRVRTHAPASRMQGEGDAPSDVGGTRMTGPEVQRDGSKNPLVSAFSAMLGPN